MSALQVADCWAALMSGLGYRRFGAQGGDLGAGVSIALGARHADRVDGLHLNYLPGSYEPPADAAVPLTDDERTFVTQRGSGPRWKAATRMCT